MKASDNYGALAVWAGGGPKHVQQVRYRVTEELVALWGGRGEGGKIFKSNQGGQSQCRRGGQMEEQRKEMSKNLGRKTLLIGKLCLSKKHLRKEMGSTEMAEVVSEVGERSARILNQIRCSCQGLNNHIWLNCGLTKNQIVAILNHITPGQPIQEGQGSAPSH